GLYPLEQEAHRRQRARRLHRRGRIEVSLGRDLDQLRVFPLLSRQCAYLLLLPRSQRSQQRRPANVREGDCQRAGCRRDRRKEELMSDKRRIRTILRRLEKAYPDAECALHHRNAYELLVATILSA